MTTISVVEKLQGNERRWILWSLKNSAKPGTDVWTLETTAVQMVIFPERELMTTISVVETLQESVLSHVLTWKATASCSQWVQFAETCSGRQDVVTCLSKTNSLSHSNYLCVVDPLVLVFRILVKNRPYVSRFVCNDAVFVDLLYVGWESEVFGYMYFTSRW
jgi:hypothetical protein